jgi:DNA-binding protein H-NS
VKVPFSPIKENCMFRRSKPFVAHQPATQTISIGEIDKLCDAFLAMPFPKLREIKERVDAAVVARIEEARASFAQQLEMFGLSLDDVKPAKKKRNTKVKYRDPDHPENTWSGLGKPKKWLQQYLDQGRQLTEFLVP